MLGIKIPFAEILQGGYRMLKKAMFFLKCGETGLFVFRKGFDFLRKKRKKSLKELSVLPKPKPLASTRNFSNFKRQLTARVKWIGRMLIILAKRFF
ncbi:MAG: hypothetical protein GX299_00360 [Epulopiscium sp.]|jgi:hypothetical protein|nr:hypothetical protein [Candidatus Epulonipiscium sp.]